MAYRSKENEVSEKRKDISVLYIIASMSSTQSFQYRAVPADLPLHVLYVLRKKRLVPGSYCIGTGIIVP